MLERLHSDSAQEGLCGPWDRRAELVGRVDPRLLIPLSHSYSRIFLLDPLVFALSNALDQ